MPEPMPSPEPTRIDRDLARRVAWGLLAGRTKQEIGTAEGIDSEECRRICTAPGMMGLLNAWAVFRDRRQRGGDKQARLLARWALEHVAEHGQDRLEAGERWRIAKICRIVLHMGLRLVVGWLLGQLDEASGPPCRQRRAMAGWRRQPVDLVAWAIETALFDMMTEQYPQEYLLAWDRSFTTAIADAEIFEIGLRPELTDRAAVLEPLGYEIPSKLPDWRNDHVPTRAKPAGRERPKLRAEASRSARAGRASSKRPASRTDRRLRYHAARSRRPSMIGAGTARISARRRAAPRPSPLIVSIRFKRRRRTSPPLVRLTPIERAAKIQPTSSASDRSFATARPTRATRPGSVQLSPHELSQRTKPTRPAHWCWHEPEWKPASLRP